ncbi:MAG: glutaredoxin family protein [Aquiluna sp.]|jgi:DNA-binding transcriptional LysR family regulator
MAEPIEIKLVIRQGCHLCVAAESDLARVIARFAAEYPDREYTVEVIDINAYDDLQRFSEEVPVLLINSKQVSFWRIDEKRAFDKLSEFA